MSTAAQPNYTLEGGGGKRSRRKSSPRRRSGRRSRSPRRRSGRRSRSPSKVRKYATATTQAGKNRQVWEGRAEQTGPGGLRKSQLTKNKSGKIVSKKKSKQPLNPFMKASIKARKSNATSFTYNGQTYTAKKTSTGLVVYKKGRRSSPSRMKGGGHEHETETPASVVPTPAHVL